MRPFVWVPVGLPLVTGTCAPGPGWSYTTEGYPHMMMMLNLAQDKNRIIFSLFVFFEVFVLLFNCFQVSKLNFFLTFERHQTSIFFPPGSGSIPLFSTIVPTLPYCSSIDTDRLAFWTPSSSRAQLYEGSRRLSVSWPRDTKDCSNPDNYI